MSPRRPAIVQQIVGGIALFFLAWLLLAPPLQPGRLLRFDVGGRWDTLYVSGMHAPEQGGGTTYRWTSKDGRLELPPLASPGLLTLRLATAPLAAGQEVGLSLQANAAPHVPLPPANDMATYQVLIGPSALQRLEVHLQATGALQTADDPREKSAALDYVQVTPLRLGGIFLPAPAILLLTAGTLVLLYAGLLKVRIPQEVALLLGGVALALAAVLLWRSPTLGLLLLQRAAVPGFIVALGGLLCLAWPPLTLLVLYLVVLPYEQMVTAPAMLAVTLPVGLILAAVSFLPTLWKRYWPAWMILGGTLWVVLRFHLAPDFLAFPAALVVVALVMKERLRDHRGNAVLILCLALLTALPVLRSALLDTYDGRTHLVYLNGLDVGLRAGILYPRWVSYMAYGYGSPALGFYAPVTRYLAEVAHWALGLDLLNALNLVYVLALPLAGLGMYRLMRDLFDQPEPAVLAAVAYTIFPYFLADIFVRGALAEALILSLFPWTLWAWGRLVERPGFPWTLLGGSLLAATLLTHNAMALFFLPVLLSYLALRVALLRGVRSLARPSVWAWPVLAGAIALGLSAFYWLPALAQTPLVLAGHMEGGPWDPMRFYPPERLYPPWHAFFPLTLADTYSPDLFWRPNLAQFVLAAIGLGLGWRQRSFRLPGLFWGSVALLGLFFQTGVARPVWDLLGGPRALQFPWRLLGFAGLATAPLIGALAVSRGKARDRTTWPSGAFLGIAALLAVFVLPLQTWTFWQPAGSGILTPAQIGRAMPEDHLWQFLPNWTMDPAILRQGHTGVVHQEDPAVVVVLEEEQGPAWVRARLDLSAPARVRFNQLCFPGWRGQVDGVPVSVACDSELGLIAMEIVAGSHRVELHFTDAVVQTAGWSLTGTSVAALIGAVTWLIWSHRRSAARPIPSTPPTPGRGA